LITPRFRIILKFLYFLIDKEMLCQVVYRRGPVQACLNLKRHEAN